MKSWKDVPHLFANGKFKVRNAAYQPQTIVGYYIDGCGVYKVRDDDYQELLLREANKCTLIARKIEDMTDEEIKSTSDFNGSFIPDFHRRIFRRMAKEGKIDSCDFLYFISIGVYPFSQDHFDNGTVIDINSL